jgi:hypothetical protein
MDNIGQTMVDKAEDMDSCIDIVHSEPAAQETKAKGQGKGIPQLGDQFGPLIVESGWANGWKVWVGDLPGNIDKVDIGRLCPGQIDVCVNNTRSRSGHAFAVITFENLDLAMAAFQTLMCTRFDHGGGQMHWPSVKWFGHEKYKYKVGKGN